MGTGLHVVRQGICLTLLGGMVVSIVSCDSEAESAAGSGGDGGTVTLTVGDSAATAAETLLEAAGELDDVPYEIEFATFTSGPPQIEAANAGQLDIALVGSTPPILAGDTATSVVQATASSGEGTALLVPEDSDIDSVEDLAGATVGVTQGSAGHGLLLLALDEAGVDPDEVEPAFIQPPDAHNAFHAGDLDAWAIWDPYAVEAEESGAKVLARADEFVDNYAFTLAADHALADPDLEEAVGDFLARWGRASIWAEENVEEWSEIYAAETGIDLDTAIRQNERSNPVPVPIDDNVVEAQDEIARLFEEAGLIDDFPGFAALIDDRFDDDLEEIFDAARNAS